LIFQSCGTKNEKYWCFQTIDGICLKSQRIYHSPCKQNICFEPEFEIIKNNKEIRAQFKILENTTFSTENDFIVEAVIKVDEENAKKFNLKRLTGGQCLMVPNDICSLIVLNLKQNKQINICFNNYHILLKPSNFNDLWNYKQPLFCTPQLFKSPR
jgi:propanediol utilization protein